MLYARIERKAIVLTSKQLRDAVTLAAVPIEQEMWTQFTAKKGDELLGWAYLDTHQVRALRETLLIVVAPDGSVNHIEVVAFAEPPEYLPKQAWFDQFTGLKLDDELALRRSIRPVTGATLSSHAATDAVRRVLAVHSVFFAIPVVKPVIAK